MAVPKFDDLYNPLLKALQQLGGSATIDKIENQVATILVLSQEDRNQIHRGNRTKLDYRLAWASNYLKRYGLIDKSKRGVWSLTEQGKITKEVDKDEVSRIVNKIDSDKYSQRMGKKGFENVDIQSILNKVNIDDFKYSPHFLSNPGVRVIDILSNVEKEWVLPNFQRYYDWEKEDVRAFLESIFNDYFVGSLLLWKVDKDPEIAFFPIEGVNEDIKEPKIIILDGQQRITSLYYAIKAPTLKEDPIKSFFYIDFKNFFNNVSKDLVIVDSKRLSINESVQYMLFPFYELENHHSWIRQFEDMYENEVSDRRKFKEIVRIMDDRIRHIWQNFQIPHIDLPASMKLHHVVDIFENINTKGKLLDAFDLLIAASSKHKIDLRTLWENSCQEYPELSRYAEKTKNKIRMYILQSISLIYHPISSCKKKDIIDLYEQIYPKERGKDPKTFENHWKEMSKYVHLAIKKMEDLKDGFGIVNEDYVPFMPTMPILAALIKEVESRENKHLCNMKINQWYWSVVFNESYSSAVDSQLTSDFKELKEWFTDDSKIPTNVEEARSAVQNMNLRKISSLSNAKYKGILSLLAIRGSRDLQTGEMVNDRNDYHKDHLFPKSKSQDFSSTRKEIDSILNMAWLTKSTNEQKGNKEPKKYFEEFCNKSKTGGYSEVLESHYINKVAYECLFNNAFDGFIKERETLFLAEIKRLIGWTEEDETIENQTEFDQLISSFEGEKLEFKSTFKKSMEKNVPEDVIKFSSLKTVAGFLNSKGGTLIIGFDEQNKSIIGLEHDYKMMKKQDRDGFELEFWSYLESNMPKDLVKENVTLEFRNEDGKDIAIIRIKRSPKPIFLKKGDKKILFVRSRNKTEPLDDSEEIHNYIKEHFDH